MADLRLPAVLTEIDFSSPGLVPADGRGGAERVGPPGLLPGERRHPRMLIFGLTSVSTYAAVLEAASFGHNRDGEPLPQENVALVCDRHDGIQLFCRQVPGSVPDVVPLDHAHRNHMTWDSRLQARLGAGYGCTSGQRGWGAGIFWQSWA